MERAIKVKEVILRAIISAFVGEGVSRGPAAAVNGRLRAAPENRPFPWQHRVPDCS